MVKFHNRFAKGGVLPMMPLNDRVFSHIMIKIAENKIPISDIMKEELNRFWEMSRNGHIQNDG